MAKILVVDDDRDLCRVISDILKEKGYAVGVAYDGKSALNKIKKQKYGLMILDYKLSGLNGLSSGLTVLEELRPIKPHPITIMISAFGTEPVRLKAKELGAYAFLDKPFDIDELIRLIKRALIEQKRRCINEADLHKLHSHSSSDDRCFGSSGFCNGKGSSSSSTNSSANRHPINSVRASKSLVS